MDVPTPPTRDTGETVAPTCDPLTLDPSDAITLPFGLVQFTGSGGSGVHRFEIDNPDAGELDEQTGAFVAHGTGGHQATVTLTDANCPGEETATIDVVVPMTVEPVQALLTHGQGLTPLVSDGSGTATCELVDNASGGSLTGCSYTAGTGSGRDLVRVTDTVTGQFVDLAIDVSTQATLAVAGGDGVYIPVGGEWRPRAVAGSFLVDAGTPVGPFTSVGGAVFADGPGSGSVELVDRYTGDVIEVPLHGIAPVSPAIDRDGERSSQGIVHRLGDVNGDGYNDAALAFIEPSIGAHYSGLVAIYAGGPFGLEPTPAQVFHGTSTFETFGQAIATADVNGDGHLDLLIGSDRNDNGGTNTGAVFIHHGLSAGFFEDTPSRSLYGELEFSRFGSAVAPCDFDGDGFVDLAVGGIEAADLATATPADNQGAVFVFWGSAAGYSDRADFEIFGALPAGGTLEAAPGLELGTTLAAGDLDGDGDCDLAAGMPAMELDGSGTDGLVYIFEGRPGEILSREPVRILTGRDGHNGAFGRRLSIGDVDGDGRDDLLTTAWREDLNGSSSGAAYLYLGVEDLGDQGLVPVSVDDADWMALGTEADDHFGADAQLVDFDLDGRSDILLSAHRAEVDLSSQGMVFLFEDPDTALGVPATELDATREFVGPAQGERFGTAAAVVGDTNANGLPDLMMFSGFADTYGVEAGLPSSVDGLTGNITPLELPGEPGGHEIGKDAAWFDTDGDGMLDIVFGVPEAGVVGEGGNAGQVMRLRGLADGSFEEPEVFLGGHSAHSGSDRFGYAVTRAGDFDGDGFEDLAIVARSDSRLSSVVGNSNYTQPVACPTPRSLAGALLIYRGSATGLETDPAFVWHGPESNGKILQVAGPVDHDGDGRDDLLVSSTDWDVGGGFAVIYGRAWSGGATDVLCDDTAVTSDEPFDRLGFSITAVGDIDGDGCGEFAVGETGEELHVDYYAQGALRVLWGHTGPGCATQPMMSTLTVDHVGTGLGSALAAGDADGDGIVDIAVGGAEHRDYFAEVGAAWWVPGTHLLGVERQPIAPGVIPDDGSTVVEELLPNTGLQRTYGVVGTTAAGLFGGGMGVVETTSNRFVAIAEPQGDTDGAQWTGGVGFYDVGPDGLDRVPRRILVGEATPYGLLGTRVIVAPDDSDRLIVTAPESSVEGVETGAFYVLDMAM